MFPSCKAFQSARLTRLFLFLFLSFPFLLCRLLWPPTFARSCKTHPGAVIHLSDCPTDPSKVICYQTTLTNYYYYYSASNEDDGDDEKSLWSRLIFFSCWASLCLPCSTWVTFQRLMLTKKHSNVNKTKQNTELHGVAARGGQLVAAVIVVREPYGTQRFPEFDAAPAFIQFDDRRLAGLYFDAIVCCDDIKDGETDGIYQLLVPFWKMLYTRERERETEIIRIEKRYVASSLNPSNLRWRGCSSTILRKSSRKSLKSSFLICSSKSKKRFSSFDVTHFSSPPSEGKKTRQVFYCQLN